MIKKILLSSLLIFSFSCNENNTENNHDIKNNDKENISEVTKINSKTQDNSSNKLNQNSNFNPKEDSDTNNDGVINYKDWNSLSKTNQYKLIEYYNNLTYQSLGLNPSKDIREKEIKNIIDKINKIYLTKNSSDKDLDLYELILSFKS